MIDDTVMNRIHIEYVEAAPIFETRKKVLWSQNLHMLVTNSFGYIDTSSQSLKA